MWDGKIGHLMSCVLKSGPVEKEGVMGMLTRLLFLVSTALCPVIRTYRNDD